MRIRKRFSNLQNLLTRQRSRPKTAECDGLAACFRPIVISPPLPPVLLVKVSSIDSCLRHEAEIQIHKEDRR